VIAAVILVMMRNRLGAWDIGPCAAGGSLRPVRF